MIVYRDSCTLFLCSRYLGDSIMIAHVYCSDLVSFESHEAWVDFLLANIVGFDMLFGWFGPDL